MDRAPILEGKRAVIFGAGGAVGSGVATELAAEGARVFVSGRTRESVDRVAERITSQGGLAQAETVDVLDEAAVEAYLDDVVRQAGGIDVAFNATGPQARDFGNGTSGMELPVEQFMLPLTTLVQSQFITARAAARHMLRQHSGVILFLTAVPANGSPGSAAIGSAFGAVESLLRGLATELSPAGVRLVGIRSGAMVETRTIQQSFENVAKRTGVTQEQLEERVRQSTLLKRSPTVTDTARLAAFLVSDRAQTLTGTIVNATSGAILG
jgi:NAD(P)-dependent dehydrogenase (short-subunit alcohol dehydrogenase family)